jgi:hypothetical protein
MSSETSWRISVKPSRVGRLSETFSRAMRAPARAAGSIVAGSPDTLDTPSAAFAAANTAFV